MENLYLIAGLGNPGREYAQTRHNAGFVILDRFAERQGAQWKSSERFQARVARTAFGPRPLVLVQPQTFMNLSGTSVRAAADYYKLPHDRLLIVVDDADLPFGELRLRASGSSGGHHGLDSIEQHLGTREYARLRVGIGRRTDGVREITGYVLGRFEAPDMPLLKAVSERACDQIECWLAFGIGKAMSQFNGLVNPPQVKES